MDPNALELSEDDVDLDRMDEESGEVPLTRSCVLGPAILIVGDRSLVGDVVSRDGEQWFIADREASWRNA